jgi:hypothetical protein
MARVALFEILLLLAPFIAFAIYMLVARGRVGRGEVVGAPVLWLSAAGLVLAALGLAWFHRQGAAPPDAVYVPPRYEDGVLVPGHVEPRPATSERAP